MNIYDFFSGLFASPSARLENEAHRQGLEKLKGMGAKNQYYDSTGSGRRGFKNAKDSSPQNIVRAELVRARRMARDLYRNNSIHKAAVDAVTFNTVVHGIRPKIEAATPVETRNGRNRRGQSKANKRRISQLQTLVEQAMDSIQMDADGRHNMYGLQWQAVMEMVKSGEALLIRKRLVTPVNGIHFKVKLVSGDFLDHLKDGTDPVSGNRIIQGIEYNADDEAVGYWIFPEHPSNNGFFSRLNNKSQRIDAANVIHLFDAREPGQNRGLPWGMASFNRIRNLDQFQDARLELMKIASCMVGAVKNTNPVGNTTKGDPLPDRAEPGLILRLGASEEMSFNSPPSVGGQSEFVREELQIIATDFGVWYPEITGDMSKINFSSGRLGWMSQHKRCVNIRRRLLIPHLCHRLWQWLVDDFELQGIDTRGIRCKWLEPPREMFDPTKEVPPMIKMIRAGLKSMQDALIESGENPELHLEQIKQWNDWLDGFGITLDTDPRKTNSSGGLNSKLSTQNANQPNSDPDQEQSGDSDKANEDGPFPDQGEDEDDQQDAKDDEQDDDEK